MFKHDSRDILTAGATTLAFLILLFLTTYVTPEQQKLASFFERLETAMATTAGRWPART